MNIKTAAVVFFSLSVILFGMYKLERAAAHPIIRLTDALSGTDAEAGISLEMQNNLDQITTEFRLNPIVYVRIYDYNVESGPARLVYHYKESLPLGKELAAWMTLDERWRVEVASVFGESDFLNFCLIGTASCFLIAFLSILLQLSIGIKKRKDSNIKTA